MLTASKSPASLAGLKLPFFSVCQNFQTQLHATCNYVQNNCKWWHAAGYSLAKIGLFSYKQQKQHSAVQRALLYMFGLPREHWKMESIKLLLAYVVVILLKQLKLQLSSHRKFFAGLTNVRPFSTQSLFNLLSAFLIGNWKN